MPVAARKAGAILTTAVLLWVVAAGIVFLLSTVGSAVDLQGIPWPVRVFTPIALSLVTVFAVYAFYEYRRYTFDGDSNRVAE